MYKLILKELILLLALFLPTGQVLYAQAVLPPVTKSVAKAGTGALAKVPKINPDVSVRFAGTLSPQVSSQITKTLQQRVLTSAARFEQIRANLPEIDSRFLSLRLVGGKALSKPIQESPKVLYPQAPFLQTQEQLGLYFLARNNRAQATWYPRFVAQYQEIGQRLEDFKQAKTPITHPIEKDISYVAEQIPEDISYLLIGECHYLPDMPKTVSDLISYLHYVYQPGREIIVLTEFLPEMVTWGQPGPVSTWDIYVNLWESLQGMGGIPAIGMEPAFKFNDSASEIITEEPQSPTTRDFIADISEGETSYTPAERDTSSQIASSPEGVRLRNERFLQIIKQVRQEHPDALLVIYTGGGHVEYGQPYSLGDALAGPKTRVISLIPAPVQKNGEWYAPAVNFDIATRMQFIFDRLIQFNDPELTKLSGADIRWKIPIIHLPK